MSKKKPFEHEIDPELLAEIEEWEQQEHDEPEGYYFTNLDPYLKPAPLPPDHPRHNFWFDEDGHIRVKNPSAFWLPEFTLQKEIGGTIYSVTGTYDGTETLDKKMERIMAEKFTEKLEDTQAVRSTSRPTPIPFGIRSRGKIPKKIKRFSTILILRLSNRKSLTRCRKSDSSDTGERQRARAVRFRAWCSALIADRSSTTPPPTTLKSGRTFSSAPRTEPTRTSAAGITSEPSFWRMWSGNT